MYTVRTLRWWQQRDDNLFHCNYLVKKRKEECAAARLQHNRVESKSICGSDRVGSVPRKHSVRCLNWKVFLLNYDMGTLIRIELSATPSPDIFTITQRLLRDRDKAAESEQVQTTLKNFAIAACPSQCEQTEQLVLDRLCLDPPNKIIENTSA